MLHLAQVQKQEPSGEPKLRLLARQESGSAWVAMIPSQVIDAIEANACRDGLLVLVDISSTQQILRLEESTDLILGLLNYLSGGITPDFLQQEKERIEQGLQSLTLEKQELARKTLELEARREELQALEEKLNRKQLELDTRQKTLQALEEKLNRKQVDLDTRQKDLQAWEEKLERERTGT